MLLACTTISGHSTKPSERRHGPRKHTSGGSAPLGRPPAACPDKTNSNRSRDESMTGTHEVLPKRPAHLRLVLSGEAQAQGWLNPPDLDQKAPHSWDSMLDYGKFENQAHMKQSYCKASVHSYD